MNIEISNIKKQYKSGKKTVLKGISFKASSGQCIGILGSNGCGKTTLLSILAGINTCDSGSILIDGTDIINNATILKNTIGYVPQGNPLMEELSARDNLKLWYCDSVLDMDEELDHGVLKMLGIDKFINEKVNRMSGGMKKRLSIGCSIANNPKILILDEPGASLDIICKKQIVDYLNDFKSNGGIIILTSHEEQEIKLCDHIYIIKDGKLKAMNSSSIEEITASL